MSSPDQLIERFYGGDPITGMQALHDLLALGVDGEEALFSRSIEFPTTVQVRRRWLQYVASRGRTVVGRLIDRMQNQDRFHDAYAAAYLFAGLGENRMAIDVLYDQLKIGFDRGQPTSATIENYELVSNRFMAWGYAGGSARTLWHFVHESSFAWERLKTFAFRASCAAVARTNASDCWAIEQLITHEWQDYELAEISDSPDAAISHQAIDNGEFWASVRDAFMTWRRGELADEILRRWSQHTHWRVRDFGAGILSSLGFQRTVTPVIEWLRREPVKSVRNSLLHALERSETSTGADALIEYFNSSSKEGRVYLARAGWRASDRTHALAALNAVADDEDARASAEAMVSLARLGHRHVQLTQMLDSQDYYCRLNAALAVAYLGDKSTGDQLLAMQREAATPFERIYLAAALAIFGKPNGAMELNAELVAAAGSSDFQEPVDLFFAHRHLQAAVFDGLATEGVQDFVNAWRAEMEPLDPIAQPVILRTVTIPAKQCAAAERSQSGEHAQRGGVPAGSLNIFISYSHQDERMRVKLGQHLAPLVDNGLIRIWHDREIEAGADWEGEINKEIGEADIILLLVSASFLNSRYCRTELLRAIEQRSAGKSLPIPIILRPCEWTSVFNRGDYKTQALPRDDRPVAGGRWPNQDAAFAAIVKELRTKFERMRG
jgi:hypothetical protein